MKPKLLISSLLLALVMLATNIGDAWAWRGGYYRGGWFRANYARSFYRPGWTHNQTFSRAPGQYSLTRSWQRPTGVGATRNINGSCSGGTCARNISTTTNSGKTWTHAHTVTAGNGSVNWSRSGNGAYGASSARQGGCTAGSGCSSNASLVGAKGNAYTAQRALTPNGQGGYNYNATLTGPHGTVTRSFP